MPDLFYIFVGIGENESVHITKFVFSFVNELFMKELPDIKKPVFIVGPERSGTTLFYSLLSNVDEFYWFSRVDSVIPGWPFGAEVSRRLLRFFDRKPYIAKYGKISSIEGVNTPSECNSYWKRFFGWGDEDNYLVENDRFEESDLSDQKKEFIINDFRKRLSYSGKKRMLLKQPGFSLKMRFWNRIFPDAIYFVCVRNIEDNIASLVKVKKESNEKFWGTKVTGWKEYLEADYKSQACFQLKWVYSMMAADLKNQQIAQKTMVISHDQLIAAPEQQLKKAVQFCGAKWNERMNDALKGIVRQKSSKINIDASQSPRQILMKLEERVDSHLNKVEGNVA